MISKSDSQRDGGEHDISHPEARANQLWKSLAICIFLAVAVWVVFGQTLRYEFINYDDNAIVYDNPVVTQGLNLHEMGWILTHNSGRDSWFPLTDISHMLDWQIFGPNAGGHHFTNVLLHTVNVILLFLLLQKLTGAMWRSAFVAAVFAIHPLRVESVAWVAERKDVQSGFFFMLALWTWTRYAQKRPIIENRASNVENAFSALNPGYWTVDYYLTVIFFILGVMSKPILVTLPCVLLLLDYWPLNRASAVGARRPGFLIWVDLILEKWPFFLLCAAGCAVTLLTERRVVTAAQPFSLPWRAGNALMAYVDYMAHMFYPVGLALLYPHPQKPLSVLRLCLSILILLGISAGAIMGRRKYPYLLMGWLWFLGMFLPVIDIMQTGGQSRADRYTYLPEIGLCIMIAWGVTELSRSWPNRRVVLGSVAAIILIALTADAYVQTTYWKNSFTIWTRTLACWPQSFVAHNSLGVAFNEEGDVSNAVQNFQEAIQINPKDANSINNLGDILVAQGKLDEAIQDYHHALQIEPENYKALNSLSVALSHQGKLSDAMQYLEHSMQINPRYAQTYFDLGNLYTGGKDYEDAEQNYEQALQLNPNYAEAHCNLGMALLRQGKMDDAIRQFEQAIRLKPHYLEALNNLGGAFASQGNMSEATKYYEQALLLKPDDPNILNNLGVTLARQGKVDTAIECFREATLAAPNDPSSYSNLGIALSSQGKKDEAIKNFQEALYLARAQNNIPLEQFVQSRLRLFQTASPQPTLP